VYLCGRDLILSLPAHSCTLLSRFGTGDAGLETAA
jgi:hypothetical protein